MEQAWKRCVVERRLSELGVAMIAGIAALLVAGGARAMDFEVTYELSVSPSHQLSSIAHGAPITELSATLIAPFPSASATAWSGTPSLQTLVLHAAPVGTPNQSGSGYNPGGTFVLPGFPAAADSCGSASCLWLRTGAVPLGFVGSQLLTSHLSTFVNIAPGAGNLSFFARQRGRTSGTGTYTIQRVTQVVGTEVSRTPVPEPDRLGLLGAGATTVFGAAATRRWRRDR